MRSAILLLLLAVLAASAARAADVTAMAALRSDDPFRGIDQSNGLAASAGLDAGLRPVAGSRPYVGGSVASNRMAGGSEIDLYAGATRSLVVADVLPLTVDAGVVGYLFPQDHDGLRHRDLDALEVYAGVGVGPASVKLWLSPDYFGSGAAGGYLQGRLRWPLGGGVVARAAIGLAAGPGVQAYTAALTEDRRGHAYADAEAALEYAWSHGITLRAAISGSTLSLGEQATGGDQAVRVWLGLRKDFDLGRL